MQQCALNAKEQLIHISKASKQTDYRCHECGQVVRMRSGLHRQPHYFHLQSNDKCKQHGKGMVHLALQNWIQTKLPEGEVHLEYRFDKIGRIADVVWIRQQLIFEIQCSPITAAEVESRNRDYASVGFQVVWILHDQRYNKKRLTAAEHYLQGLPHYFSNINIEGNGIIYDHLAIVDKGKRLMQLPQFSIDLTQIKDVVKPSKRFFRKKKIPKQLLCRLNNFQKCFSGDIIDSYFTKAEDGCVIDQFFQKHFHSVHQNKMSLAYNYIKGFFRQAIVRPYLCIFKLLLERACR